MADKREQSPIPVPIAQIDSLCASESEAGGDRAYSEVRKQAAAEMGLARSAFPEESEWDLEGSLADRSEET